MQQYLEERAGNLCALQGTSLASQSQCSLISLPERSSASSKNPNKEKREQVITGAQRD